MSEERCGFPNFGGNNLILIILLVIIVLPCICGNGHGCRCAPE